MRVNLSVAVLILGQKEADDHGHYGSRSFWFEVLSMLALGGKTLQGVMSD